MSGFFAIAGQYPGSQTNDNPSAGNLGEVLSASATAVSLVTSTQKTVISLSFTPGRWEISGVIQFIPAATTGLKDLIGSITTVDNTGTATIGRFGRLSYDSAAGVVTGGRKIVVAVPPFRFLVPSSGAVTYYLIGEAEFTVSTCTADGLIRGMRV